MTSEKKTAVIIQAPYDKTSSFGKGASKAPEKILNVMNEQIEVYDLFSDSEPLKSLNILYPTTPAIKDRSPKDMVNIISELFKENISKGFTLLVGGDHSVSIGSFNGMKKSGLDDVTILQIDAHADLREDDSDYSNSPSDLAHSTIARNAHKMGFPIVQVGVRAIAKWEKEYIQNNDDITTYFWPQVENDDLISKIISSIKTEKVYLTLDIDGIDPSHMPGTGTPVPGGLSWYFTFAFLKKLYSEKDVIAADLVEVIPNGNDDLTPYAAAQILYSMLGFKLNGK